MNWVGYALAAAAASIVVYIATRMIRAAVVRYRGPMLVECPENHETAAVAVKGMQAAVTAGFGNPRLELKQCSRWPERQGCGQQCLEQIESSPSDCLVRTFADRFYQGKTCAVCGTALGEVDWMERQPALLGPDGRSVRWRDVAPEQLPALLETHRALCFDCHVAESFRQQHPELVTDNPWARPAGPSATS